MSDHHDSDLDVFLVSLTTAIVRLARHNGYEETARDVLDAFRDWNNR